MRIGSFFRSASPLFILALILFTAFILLQKWPLLVTKHPDTIEIQAISAILPYLPHAVFLTLTGLGWCVGNAGLLLSGWFMGLFYLMLTVCDIPVAKSHPDGFLIVFCLLFTFFSLMHRHRASLLARVSWMSVSAISVLVMAFWSKGSLLIPPADKAAIFLASLIKPLSLWLQPLQTPVTLVSKQFPSLQPSTLICAISAVFAVFRFFRGKDALLAGYAGAIIAVWLAFASGNTGLAQPVFFSAGGLILIVTAVWSAFNLAYHDELTGLPGRRSLNEALAGLGKAYVIAMIDVDHFKHFNDTYGHKTGDQVLRRLATQMQLISGGAHVFRYGGEEFTALFPGKPLESALARLEKFRETLAATPFIVRGKARKKSSAKARNAGKTKGGKAVRVTVSIGVAEPGNSAGKPADVIRAADKALYRAKKAGRNRVMV